MAERGATKFEAKKLLLGESKVAAQGLAAVLGITPADLAGCARGLEVMQQEIETYGDEDDKDNFRYVAFGVGLKEELLPKSVKESMKSGLYHGGSMQPVDYDTGHEGKTLADWMMTPEVLTANLSEAEFVALRLYTSSSHKKINDPLRKGTKPHPWKMTVFLLSEAIKKMRSVRAEQGSTVFMKPITLWRGAGHRTVDMEAFKMHGGTELALMSTTKDLSVALSYSKCSTPIVFKYTVSALMTGVCIQFCSLYPKETEYLYPPLTHLRYKADYMDNGMHVIEIEPQIS